MIDFGVYYLLFVVGVLPLLAMEQSTRRGASDRIERRVARRILRSAASMLAWVVSGIAFVTAGWPELPALLAGTGRPGAIAVARAGLHGSVGAAILVVVVLVVLSVAAVSAQYLVNRTFGWRVVRTVGELAPTYSGRLERGIRAVDTVLVAPIAEELVFRAALPAILFSATGQLAVAIGVSVVVFAVLHYEQGWTGIANAAILAVPLTLLFLVTEQLIWSILLHAAANLMATVISPEVSRARRTRAIRQAIAEAALDRA